MPKLKCNMAHARTVFYQDRQLSATSRVQCPVCQLYGTAYQLQLHHMIPKSFQSDLWYDSRYMVLVHRKCHQRIHMLIVR